MENNQQQMMSIQGSDGMWYQSSDGSLPPGVEPMQQPQTQPQAAPQQMAQPQAQPPQQMAPPSSPGHDPGGDFLPQDYEAPTGEGGNYMKLKGGANQFRILSRPIIGWLDFDQANKPHRFHMNQKPTQSMVPGKNIRHFWGMVVYNYQDQAIQILEITQATIQGPISLLAKDPQWGSPLGYDLTVTRSGEGRDGTKYVTQPSPPSAVSPQVQDAYFNRPVNLEALWTGADPFQ